MKKVKAVEAEAEAMSKDFRKVLITSGDTQFELWTNRVKNNDLLRFGLMASDVKSFKRLTKLIVPFRLINENSERKRYFSNQIFVSKIK